MAAEVVIARILGARGNKGEVAAEPWSDHRDRYRQLAERAAVVTVKTPAGAAHQLPLQQAWWHRSGGEERLILKFAGVESISAAEELAGAQVLIAAEERVPLAEGEVYLSDLVGMLMVDGQGVAVATVTAYEDLGLTKMLLAKDAVSGRDLMVPWAREICQRVDFEKRQILVDLPEGLRDLNLE